MGLFGRKKTDSASTTTMMTMQGWIVECGPKCGFMVRNHEKKELVSMVQQHMKQTHKTTFSETDALKDARATTWETPA